MKSKHLILFILINLSLFLTNCEKPLRDNPWDEKANLNPIDWAPANLQTEDISITSKKITWTYTGDNRIEGFQIDRKKGNDDWEERYYVADNKTSTWIDESITPDTSLTYTYRLFTIAGENKSSEKTTSFSASFPAPSNIQIEKLSDKNCKLTWNDNSSGEQGFKVDRRINNGEWKISYGIIEANKTTFIDTNVFAVKYSIPIDYRVYAYYGANVTRKLTVNTNVSLTPPTDLQLSVNSNTSITLSWEHSATSNQGFKIDKRIGTGNWQEAFATLYQTQKTYTDISVNLISHDYNYRVYAYYGKFISKPAEVSVAFPAVITTIPSNITATTVTSGGFITNGSNITARGLVWSTSPNPTIDTNNGITINGAGTGTFTSNIASLIPNTIYFIRAYASNNVGTNYGSQLSFTTQNGIIQVTTTGIASITAISAQSGGNILTDGGANVISRGVVWSTTQNPTINLNQGSTINGSGIGAYMSSLSGLTPNTLYYLRAYSTNSVGTYYGIQLSFTTMSGEVQLTTSEVTSIATNSAISGGIITSDGGTSITARGVVWSTNQTPTISSNQGITNNGVGTGTYISNITGLSLNTQYFVRAYATNSVGTFYGNQLNFIPFYSIGESYQGGVVAYIYQPFDPGYVSGQVHGLIAAFSDQSIGVEWGCPDINVGATSISIGAGMANTLAIINGCSTNNIAARKCYDLVLSGYSDWCMPSINELNMLYQNRIEIGSFANSDYWSSTETYPMIGAFYINFYYGSMDSKGKDSLLRVRAIRYF